MTRRDLSEDAQTQSPNIVTVFNRVVDIVQNEGQPDADNERQNQSQW